MSLEVTCDGDVCLKGRRKLKQGKNHLGYGKKEIVRKTICIYGCIWL